MSTAWVIVSEEYADDEDLLGGDVHGVFPSLDDAKAWMADPQREYPVLIDEWKEGLLSDGGVTFDVRLEDDNDGGSIVFSILQRPSFVPSAKSGRREMAEEIRSMLSANMHPLDLIDVIAYLEVEAQ